MEVDLSTEVVTFRIVYAGPEGASTLRSLRGLHMAARLDERDDLNVMRTSEDRFVSFLYSPRSEPPLGGLKVAFQAVAAPAPVRAAAARRLLLLSADALVFLPERLDPAGPETRDAFRELMEDLAIADRSPETLPIVVQSYRDADPRLVLDDLGPGRPRGLAMIPVDGDTVEGVLEVFDAARAAARKRFRHLDPADGGWVARCLRGRRARPVPGRGRNATAADVSASEHLLVRLLIALVLALAGLCLALVL
jgi:hypothetical protein